MLLPGAAGDFTLLLPKHPGRVNPRCLGVLGSNAIKTGPALPARFGAADFLDFLRFSPFPPFVQFLPVPVSWYV